MLAIPYGNRLQAGAYKGTAVTDRRYNFSNYTTSPAASRLAAGPHLCEFPAMLVAWTTVATAAAADQLAAEVIQRHLAACVQIDGPIVSHFRWEGKIERSQEFRLGFKFLESQRGPLEAYVHTHHPYATPEWLVVRAEHVGEKYLSWAVAVSTPSPL